MRIEIDFAIGLACSVLLASATAHAVDGAHCAVCTCQNGGLNDTIVCVAQGGGEEIEDQGPCASACSSVGQSYKSIKVVETACEDLPACDHAETPAASPLWLAGGAFALLVLGAAAVRRMRLRTADS